MGTSYNVCFLFRTTLAAYGSSQARGQIRAAAEVYSSATASPDPSHVFDLTYATARGNARSLTHWVRPEIEPTFSWILVRFLTPWATMGTPFYTLLTNSTVFIYSPILRATITTSNIPIRLCKIPRKTEGGSSVFLFVSFRCYWNGTLLSYNFYNNTTILQVLFKLI